MARILLCLAALACLMVCVYGDGAYGHYHYAKTTCADHYKPGVKNGFYKVYSTKHYGAIKVYCDFETEPGNAYTLVMSSDAATRANFFITGTDNPFTGLPLIKVATTDSAFEIQRDGVNGNAPNNDSYRLPFADMEKISKSSSVWRYTCGTAPSASLSLPEFFLHYIRVAIAVVNPMTFTTSNDNAVPGCETKAEYASGGNVAGSGTSCANCGVTFIQDGSSGASSTLRSDPTVTTCTLNGNNFAHDTNIGSQCIYLQFWFGKSV